MRARLRGRAMTYTKRDQPSGHQPPLIALGVSGTHVLLVSSFRVRLDGIHSATRSNGCFPGESQFPTSSPFRPLTLSKYRNELQERANTTPRIRRHLTPWNLSSRDERFLSLEIFASAFQGTVSRPRSCRHFSYDVTGTSVIKHVTLAAAAACCWCCFYIMAMFATTVVAIVALLFTWLSRAACGLRP